MKKPFASYRKPATAIVILAVFAGAGFIASFLNNSSGVDRVAGKSSTAVFSGRTDMNAYSKPYGKSAEFARDIAPFFWVDTDNSFSLCLSARERFIKEVFASRSREGFRGSGDDWASLAVVFLEEKMPELKNIVDFDPETGMFCAFSGDEEALAKFALTFRAACADDALIRDLFSRAQREPEISGADRDRILRDILNISTDKS